MTGKTFHPEIQVFKIRIKVHILVALDMFTMTTRCQAIYHFLGFFFLFETGAWKSFLL